MSNIKFNYDAVMLIVLCGVTLHGMWRGAVRQIASLAALIASSILAVRFSEPLAPLFGKDGSWNRYAAMLAIYLAASLVIWLAFRMLRKLVDRLRLQDFDHHVGGAIGLIKGLLLCTVITFFAVTLSPSARQAVLNSYSGYVISVALHRATPILPENIRMELGGCLEDFDRKLPHRPPAAEPSAPPPAAGPPSTSATPATPEAAPPAARPTWPPAVPATPRATRPPWQPPSANGPASI